VTSNEREGEPAATSGTRRAKLLTVNYCRIQSAKAEAGLLLLTIERQRKRLTKTVLNHVAVLD
jgi:hypothetical protein